MRHRILYSSSNKILIKSSDIPCANSFGGTVAVSRVKPYLEADGTVRALQKQGLVRIPDKGDFVVGREYKVRHILGHKGIPGTTKGKNKAMYLVNWDGFDAEDQMMMMAL